MFNKIRNYSVKNGKGRRKNFLWHLNDEAKQLNNNSVVIIISL